MKKTYIAGNKYDNSKAAKQIAEAIEEYKGPQFDRIKARNRLYKGQPWTTEGNRGKEEVTGLTMRDIRDCLFLACYDSRPPGIPITESVEALPFEDMSIEAIAQNLNCLIERYMGIFPNIKRTRFATASKGDS